MGAGRSGYPVQLMTHCFRPWYCGLRQDEILDLSFNDIDEDGETLHEH
jgi:integrase